MVLIYSGEYSEIKHPVVFLAGPSPRSGQTLEWRKEAIQHFQNIGFDGTIVIPEPRTGKWDDYLTVVDWEHLYLELSDTILFWVPRDIENEIYGFTTNVEFGMYLHSGKIIYGRPDNSDKNRYLDYWYSLVYSKQPYNDLLTIVKDTINNL